MGRSFPYSLARSQASVLCTDRIRLRAFLDRRIVGFLLRLVSAHSDICLNGCHSKFSSGSTSLDAFFSRKVLNATNNIEKLKRTPTSITSHPGASPTVDLVTKTVQKRSRSCGVVVGIGEGWI